MAGMTRDLEFRYLGDASDLQRASQQAEKALGGVDKEARQATGGVDVLKKGALALGGAFAASAVLNFAKNAVNQFSRLEESVNAVNVIYGESADAVRELGDVSAEKFGLAESALNEAAVSLGAFTEKINASDPADAFQNIIQRATDFGSVMNLTTDETLEKFRSGLAGESEPLRQFGIDLSAATVQQVALDAGIIETGETMTETEKVQARYLTLMRQTEKTAGDFANTADSLANRQKTLNARWTDAQATLGEELAPVMIEVLEAGTDLIPVFKLVASGVGKVVDELGPLIDGLGFLAGQLGDTTEESGGFWQSLGEGIGWMTTASGVARKLDEELWRLPWERHTERAGGYSAEQRLLKEALEDTTPPVEDLGEAAGYTDEQLADMSEAAADAHTELAELAEQAKNARDEQHRLVSKVYDAERSFQEYESALEDAWKDEQITADEAAELNLKLLEVEAAAGEIGPEEVQALRDSVRETVQELGLAPSMIDTVIGRFENLNRVSLGDLFRQVDALNQLQDKGIQVRVQVDVPSSLDFTEALQKAMSAARRRGDWWAM